MTTNLLTLCDCPTSLRISFLSYSSLVVFGAHMSFADISDTLTRKNAIIITSNKRTRYEPSLILIIARKVIAFQSIINWKS